MGLLESYGCLTVNKNKKYSAINHLLTGNELILRIGILL